MTKVIQITNTYQGDVWKLVSSCVPDGFTIRRLPENSKEALLACVADADYILASGRVAIDSEVLEAAVRLQMIQRTGVGLDSLDLQALEEKKIPLYVNYGVNAESVAEHALLLILAGLRNLCPINSRTKEGLWNKQGQGIQTRELQGRTVGIIGMGRIGQTLARLLRPFGVRILYFDQFRVAAKIEENLKLCYTSLDTLLGESDIISLHCPLTEETRGIICEKNLKKIKPGAGIVNTARGALVCEKDLRAAIERGQISFAGLDVHEQEPLKAQDPLAGLEQVIMTPHIGGITYDSFYRMIQGAMKNILLFDQGRRDELEPYRYK